VQTIAPRPELDGSNENRTRRRRMGVLCYNDTVTNKVQESISANGHALKAVTKPGWYV